MAAAVIIAFLLWWMFTAFARKLRLQQLALSYLVVIAVTPLAGIINNHLDAQQFTEPKFVLTAPYYLSSLLLFAALARDLTRGFSLYSLLSIRGMFLIGYIVLVIIGTFFSTDPWWSLYVITWSLPNFLMFFIAGSAVNVRHLERSPHAFYAICCVAGVNLLLIAYAFISGRATNVFETRGMGSVFASSAVALTLTLFWGLAWFHVRRRPVRALLLILLTVASGALGISRIAAFTLLFVSWFVFEQVYHRKVRGLILAFVLAVGAWVAVAMVDRASPISWGTRLTETRESMSIRFDEFGGYWSHALAPSNYWGVGQGMTHRWHPAGYSSLHDLFLTEAFECGLPAAIILFGGLLTAVFDARRLFLRSQFPVSLGLISYLLIAHTGGADLCLRTPEYYNTPLYGCLVFFLLGISLHMSRHARSKARAKPRVREEPLDPIPIIGSHAAVQD